MTSNRRIVAAFVLGGGVVLGLAMTAIASGLLACGEPTAVASVVALLAASGFSFGAYVGLNALRRGQSRAQARLEALAEKDREALLEKLAAFQKSAGGLMDGAGEALGRFSKAIEVRRGAIARASDSAKVIREGLGARAFEIESLGQRIRESVATVVKMDRANSRALELINGLAVSIEQASLATREGDAFSRAIARDLENLSSGVRVARSSLDTMKDGAEHACADARHVANTMASLSLESQRIGETIEAVIGGSDAVLASNGRILDVTERLESRLGGIDDVIGVIRNLADRTKLLSINASIIATEAGEHGRAFAVVANEIKDLAGSTSRAIAEISSILSALEEGYADTVQAILRSREDVDRGANVTRNAVEMIRSIPAQVSTTAALSNEIVMRNEEQVKKGAEIAATFERMSAAIEQVGELLRQQVSRDEATREMYLAIGKSSEHMHRSAKEHAAASAEMVRAIESVDDVFSGMGRRASSDVEATERLLAQGAEIEQQMEDVRRNALVASSLLTEIVQQSRVLSVNNERAGGESAPSTPRPETAA